MKSELEKQPVSNRILPRLLIILPFFPYTDQHLQHEQQQQQQQQEEIQNSRQRNFGRMASYRYLILLVIINLTKTINFTEKSNICELPFPDDVLVSYLEFLRENKTLIF